MFEIRRKGKIINLKEFILILQIKFERKIPSKFCFNPMFKIIGQQNFLTILLRFHLQTDVEEIDKYILVFLIFMSLE